jgi:Fasciclin domain
MQVRRIATALVTLGVAFALSAAPASAHTRSSEPGNRSLASVLTADGNRFDHNWNDYDIVTEAVLAVLAAKPSSPVGVLTDGNVALTAFLPTDRAFRNLVGDLTGHWYRSESKVFSALVAAVGVDTVESVLLYHVVPGATITRKDAVKADGAVLQTALSGATITVDVKCRWLSVVVLVDADPDDRNPWVQRFDINRGNLQIAHGISEVLRPVNL